jgi:pimeloyl-ACP methyl ester carboxylesterase
MKPALRRALKGGAAIIALALLAALAYVVYGSIAWRDLPVGTLEARYGGEDLAVASIDGVDIRYRLSGSGAPLVLIHSHFFDMGMWDGWLPTLTPHFQVLRYDLSGHGLTGPDPSGRYSVARDVELLTGLLDHLQWQRAHVVGSSLGGNIAFTLAATAPERVQALVLINSGGLKRANSRAGREVPGWADRVFPLIPPIALHRFLDWMIVDADAATPALERRFVELWRREGNRSAELGRLRQYQTGDPGPLLAAIRAPTLVLWGEDNPQLPVALAQQFVDALSAAPVVQRRSYAGAGHVLPLERPAESAADTLDFLLTQAIKESTP